MKVRKGTVSKTVALNLWVMTCLGVQWSFHGGCISAVLRTSFALWFITLIKLQLWCSNWMTLWFGVTTTWETALKDLSCRKVHFVVLSDGGKKTPLPPRWCVLISMYLCTVSVCVPVENRLHQPPRAVVISGSVLPDVNNREWIEPSVRAASILNPWSIFFQSPSIGFSRCTIFFPRKVISLAIWKSTFILTWLMIR